MQDTTSVIGDIVRGVAAKHRTTQAGIGAILGIHRSAVIARMKGTTSFSAAEIFKLACAFDEDVSAFFPQRRALSLPVPVDSPLTRESAGVFVAPESKAG